MRLRISTELSREKLERTGSKLASSNKGSSSLLKSSLDNSSVSDTVDLVSSILQLNVVKLLNKSINVRQDAVDLSSGRSVRAGKVVDVLGAVTKSTLVLLLSVLSSLLGLLATLAGLLGGLLGLSGSLLGLLLSLLLGLSGGTGTSLTLPLALLLGLLLGLLEELDTGISAQSLVNKTTETGNVIGLVLLAGGLVLLLNVTLVVTVTGVIGNVLVKVLKGSPGVKVVPEGVEGVDLSLGRLHGAQGGDGLLVRETGLSIKEGLPEFDKVALGLLGGRGNVSGLIDGVELASSDRVKEKLKGLLDALEEAVFVKGTLSSLLIGVVLENLASVGNSDLLLSGLVTELGNTKNLVVVLLLPLLGVKLEKSGVLGLLLKEISLADFLNLLDVLLGLDLLILRPSAATEGSSGVGQEAGANGLNLALNGGREGGDGREVLSGLPVGGESRQNRHCDYGYMLMTTYMKMKHKKTLEKKKKKVFMLSFVIENFMPLPLTDKLA